MEKKLTIGIFAHIKLDLKLHASGLDLKVDTMRHRPPPRWFLNLKSHQLPIYSMDICTSSAHLDKLHKRVEDMSSKVHLTRDLNGS